MNLLEIMPMLVVISGTILLITITICGTKIILSGLEIDKIRAMKKNGENQS